MLARKLAISLVLLAACGGDDGGNTITVIDAPGGGSGSDASSAACTAASSYTAALTADNAGAETDGSGFDDDALQNGTAHVIYSGGALDSAAAPDFLEIDLWAGYGVFTGMDISPTTVTIAGEEADLYTCGACVYVYTDLSDDGNGGVNVADSYMAQSGTLTLSSVSGTLTGTLTNVVLAHATFDDNSQTTSVVGDCSTTVSGTFSMPIEQGSSSLRASGRPAPLRIGLHRPKR